MTDGLKDFFVKPIQGAQKEGVIGFGKGFGKGIGNLVCKPAAGKQLYPLNQGGPTYLHYVCSFGVVYMTNLTLGAIGLVGYSSVGVYKEIQAFNFGRKDAAVEVVTKLGEAEYEQASDDLRLHIVKSWCQVMMKQK